MRKLLFTHSYFYKFDPKQWQARQPHPPYGTLYAAALMREQGYEVALFDSNLRDSTDAFLPRLKKEQPDYVVIYDDGFNYLTKMCLTKMREAAFRLARHAKAAGATVITCSSDSTDHYAQYLAEGTDFVILGEGERTLQELLHHLEEPEGDVAAIRGLAFRQNGETIVTPGRPILRDLDSLPQPAWDLVDMEAYRKIWKAHHGYFSLNIATTRGCPFKCNWCAKPIYGNRYNCRSPERVADEIELLINRYGAEYFWVCDDIFGLKPGWVQRFR